MNRKTAIDWPYWGKLKQVKVFEALALLVNTEPSEQPPERAGATEAYRKRLRLLLDAMSDRQQFAPGTLNMGDPQLHKVNLIAVGAWARRNKIPLPAGFPVVPEFVAQARPTLVPAELLELDAASIIRVLSSIGTYSGVAWCSAAQYKAVIEDTIKRQAEGYFTVGEASQILKGVHADLDIKTMVARIYAASINGHRLVRDAGDRLPLSPDSHKREFADLVLDRDISEWLDQLGAGYRFPQLVNESTQLRTVPVASKGAVGDAANQSVRQARRYQTCIDAGLQMPSTDYGAMPRGIGKIAAAERISRQAFTEDVKAHIRRTFKT